MCEITPQIAFYGNEKCKNEVFEQFNKNGTIFIPEKEKDVAIKNLIISRIEVMRGISLLPSIGAENWQDVIDEDWEGLTIEDWKEIG